VEVETPEDSDDKAAVDRSQAPGSAAAGVAALPPLQQRRWPSQLLLLLSHQLLLQCRLLLRQLGQIPPEPAAAVACSSPRKLDSGAPSKK
jgi:hypothetical protein